MAIRIPGHGLAAFALLGGGAGILTAALAVHELSIVTVGAGVPLAMAIGIASVLKGKHPPDHIPLARLVAALGVVITAYPVSVLVMLAVNANSQFLISDPRLNFLSGLLLGAFAGASFMQVALRVVKKRWNNLVWSLFLATGLTTALVAFGGHSIFSASETVTFDPVFAFLLFPIGDALFSTVFGYGLVRESAVQSA